MYEKTEKTEKTEKDVRTRRTADTWKGYQAWNKDRTKERP